MSASPESSVPNPDCITSFAVDNEGSMFIVREFPDGTIELEQPNLNDFTREFRAAQAIHQMDPDHVTEERTEDPNEPRRGPDLDKIWEQVHPGEKNEEKILESQLYADEEGNVFFEDGEGRRAV